MEVKQECSDFDQKQEIEVKQSHLIDLKPDEDENLENIPAIAFVNIKEEPPEMQELQNDLVTIKQEEFENEILKSETPTAESDLPLVASENEKCSKSEDYPFFKPRQSQFVEDNEKYSVESKLTDNGRIQITEKPYKCEICHKEYIDNSQLLSHSKIHTVENPVICSNGFNSIFHFNNDERDRQFRCEICFKAFKRKSNLTDHLKIHSDQKQIFTCEICEKHFTHKSTLTQHIKLHAVEKPFKCEFCSKEFNRKNSLNKHLRIHTGEKPFKCEICSKQFIQKNGLIDHVSRIHTDLKPFRCKTCLKPFTHNYELINHERIHTGQKPFKCEICSKQFTSKHSLTKHVKIHSDEKPHKCEICSRPFVHKYKLMRHISKIHPAK